MRTIIVVLLVAGVAVPTLRGQSARFEVVSIRLNEADRMPSVLPGLRNGRLTAGRASLMQLLAIAYGITEPQVIGPDWLERNRFDIVGKAPEGVPDSELPVMLQALLRERFKLAAHLETRVMPIYHLVVSPGGVKMPVYPARDPAPDDPSARGFPMVMGTTTISQLAKTLSTIIGRPVIDKTELKERYNYFLSFARITSQPVEQAPEFGPPEIFTAVQKQLGLKLESIKSDTRVLVVDSVERMPTEN